MTEAQFLDALGRTSGWFFSGRPYAAEGRVQWVIARENGEHLDCVLSAVAGTTPRDTNAARDALDMEPLLAAAISNANDDYPQADPLLRARLLERTGLHV